MGENGGKQDGTADTTEVDRLQITQCPAQGSRIREKGICVPRAAPAGAGASTASRHHLGIAARSQAGPSFSTSGTEQSHPVAPAASLCVLPLLPTLFIRHSGRSCCPRLLVCLLLGSSTPSTRPTTQPSNDGPGQPAPERAQPVRGRLRLLRVGGRSLGGRWWAAPSGTRAHRSAGVGPVQKLARGGRAAANASPPPFPPSYRRSAATNGFCSVCYKAHLAASKQQSPVEQPVAAAAAPVAPSPQLAAPEPTPAAEAAATSPDAVLQSAAPAVAEAEPSQPADDKPVQVRPLHNPFMAGGCAQTRTCADKAGQLAAAALLAAFVSASAHSHPLPQPSHLDFPAQENRGRCFCCRKKVGLLGFECR